MKHQERDSAEPLMTTGPAQNRRRELQLDGQLSVIFSGIDATEMVMDTGTIFNLRRNGMGLHTERSLKLGMELAIFIECPDSEEDICIPEVRVEWMNGNRFGLSIRKMNPEDRARLDHAFSAAILQQIGKTGYS